MEPDRTRPHHGARHHHRGSPIARSRVPLDRTVQRDRGGGTGPGNASPAAAAAAASVVVLKSFFPLDTTLLDEKLRTQKTAAPWPEEPTKDVAEGEAIGRAIGAQVLAYAATDKTNLTTRPVNPGGPGSWTGANSDRGFYEARTFALVSGASSVRAHRQYLARPRSMLPWLRFARSPMD